MPIRRDSWPDFWVLLAIVGLGGSLWLVHAGAWELGRGSPVLSDDAAQDALAGRELAERGRMATTFALPIELAMHPSPPWPLAAIQPGPVLIQGLIETLAPPLVRIGSHRRLELELPHQREWLTLLPPFLCFLLLGVLLALGTARLIARHAPRLSPLERAGAAAVIGAAFLLDPEAQHLAIGGGAELPFTLGLVAACLSLAEGGASRRPFRFGLLLGLTASFRVNLWIGPLLSLGAALAPAALGRHHRARIFLLAMAGHALPLLPWWSYKWHAFGSPLWDLNRFALWDQVGGRTWFSLLHVPRLPELPGGLAALGVLAGKLLHHLPDLLLRLLTGPRALWIGALLAWLLVARPPRRLAVTGAVVSFQAALGVAVAALGIPWIRSVFPVRVPLEAAGMLATWALVTRLAESGSRRAITALWLFIAALAVGWGAWQTARGNLEARAAAGAHGLPSVPTLRDLSLRLGRELPPDEVVMSNLGPTLAWYARRPVLHLALTPADVDACRARLPFRHVLLAFRDTDQAWPGWHELIARPEEARTRPEWNVLGLRRWRDEDGFTIIWLELGPPHLELAAATEGRLAQQ